MLKIGEFSLLSSISINMLRHYDKLGLLVPEHVDSVNGYRYYDKSQLVTANRIVSLKELGIGLEDIQKSMRMNEEELDNLLQKKREYIQSTILQLQNQLKRIDTALSFEKEKKEYVLDIAIKTLPAMQLVSYTDIITDYADEGSLWERLMQEYKAHSLPVGKDSYAMAVNHGFDDESGKMKVEVMLSTTEKIANKIFDEHIRVYEKPEHLIASVTFKGNYSRMAEVNSAMAEWLEKNSYKMTADAFSIYHNSPGNNSSIDDYITELCFPIAN